MVTFVQQAETFMTAIAARKRNPVKTATLVAYRSLLNKWIIPAIGGKFLPDIQNGSVKPLIDIMSKAGKSPQTITSVLSLIKAVVKSAVDGNGNQLYPRTWNNEFMDVPVISAQKAPVATVKAVQQALRKADGQDAALYALLAGTGLRIGEARALMIGPDNGRDSFWDPGTATIVVRSTVSKGQIQSSPKTEAGNREIDLNPELNTYLCEMLLNQELPSVGLLFPSTTGGVSDPKTDYRHLKAVGIPGFHSLRRFRVTHLRKQGVPEGLVQFWSGHRGKTVTDRYDKISLDTDARKQYAKSAGLGFQLEAAC